MKKDRLELTVSMVGDILQVEETNPIISRDQGPSNYAICKTLQGLGEAYLLYYKPTSPMEFLKNFYKGHGWRITAY